MLPSGRWFRPRRAFGELLEVVVGAVDDLADLILLGQQHAGDVVARGEDGGDVGVVRGQQRGEAVGERDQRVEEVLVVRLLGIEGGQTGVDLVVEVVEVGGGRRGRLGELRKGVEGEELGVSVRSSRPASCVPALMEAAILGPSPCEACDSSPSTVARSLSLTA